MLAAKLEKVSYPYLQPVLLSKIHEPPNFPTVEIKRHEENLVKSSILFNSERKKILINLKIKCKFYYKKKSVMLCTPFIY